MDSCLHLLAERAGAARSWPQLQGVAREHRQLVAARAQLQRHLAAPLAAFYSLTTGLGVLTVCRVVAVPDLSNVLILCAITTYIASVCVAAEMQAVAAEALHDAVLSCPWDDWPPAARRDYAILMLHTAHPTLVRAACMAYALTADNSNSQILTTFHTFERRRYPTHLASECLLRFFFEVLVQIVNLQTFSVNGSGGRE